MNSRQLKDRVSRMKQLFYKLLITGSLLWGFTGCKKGHQPRAIPQAVQIRIDSSLYPDDSVDAFIQPYRSRLNAVLDTPLSFTPNHITKTEGLWNTPLGNLMADLMLDRAGKTVLIQQVGCYGVRLGRVDFEVPAPGRIGRTTSTALVV